MLEKLHEGHLGNGKTLIKAQEVLFWSARSYKVETEHGEHRRNRLHLLRTNDSPMTMRTATDFC